MGHADRKCVSSEESQGEQIIFVPRLRIFLLKYIYIYLRHAVRLEESSMAIYGLGLSGSLVCRFRRGW